MGDLRQTLCSSLSSPRLLGNGAEGCSITLSTGDEIIVAGSASASGKLIRDQYALATKALRSAKRQDMINRGERPSCCGDSNDACLPLKLSCFALRSYFQV